jgi:prepilin-type N-terminal cleavage/methylation domain-containing protein/prepilin-type processing-associated H-X9-DG protein
VRDTSQIRRGFTLIELLVVVAIVAVLAALVAPGLSAAKLKTRNARCVGNLRQISVACATYVSVHDVYPVFEELWWWYSKPSWDLTLDPPLKVELTPFNDEGLYRVWPTGIYDCPITREGFGSYTGADGQTQTFMFGLRNDYGYNARGVGGQVGGLGGFYLQNSQGSYVRNANGELKTVACKETSVRHPANLIAFGDLFLRSKNPALDGMLSVDNSIRPYTDFDSMLRREPAMPWKKQPSFLAHRAGANRVYADGHVSREDMRGTFAASDAQLRQWNVDDLPHGEVLSE